MHRAICQSQFDIKMFLCFILFIYLFNFLVVESSSGDLIDIIIVIVSFLYTLLCKGFRQMWKLL